MNNSNFSASDEDEEMNEEEMADASESKSNGPAASTANSAHIPMSDADTEDALKEFSFLSNEPSSLGDDPSDWHVDKHELANKVEQYKKDRTEQHSKKERQRQTLSAHSLDSDEQWTKVNSRPNRQALQAMIANLSENSGQQADVAGGDKINSGTDLANVNPKLNNSGNFSFATGPKLFLEDDAFGNDSNLGELSRISVNNNNVSLSGINDETIIDVRNGNEKKK